MKIFCLVLILFLFGMCTQKPEIKLLPEELNKPTSKTTVSLNSEQNNAWTLYFGVQDKNAPKIRVNLQNPVSKSLLPPFPEMLKLTFKKPESLKIRKRAIMCGNCANTKLTNGGISAASKNRK